MKNILARLILAPFMLLAIGCGPQEKSATSNHTSPELPPLAMADSPAEANTGGIAGTVVETMDASGYTYIQVDTGSEKIWAVAPAVKVKPGDRVVVPDARPMPNFHSKTLDRDFEMVYFAPSILSASGDPLSRGSGMPAGHSAGGHFAGGQPAEKVDLSGIEKAEGGKTVAELFDEKTALASKQVTVRGKVVKFNSQILGKNWLHVRDGSGNAADGNHDLTVTTNAEAKVGDTVSVSGKVVLDKDFGAGYKYGLIIEDAKVTVE